MTCITVEQVTGSGQIAIYRASEVGVVVTQPAVTTSSVQTLTTIETVQTELTLQLYKPTEVILSQARSDITILLDASCRMVSATPLPDYAFYLSGEDIPPYTAVYQGDDGLIYKLTPDVVDTRALQAKGISLNLVQTGDRVQTQLSGELFNVDWNWSPEDAVYVGLEGQLTQEIPTQNLFLRVGTALNPTTLFIDLEEPVIIEV